MYRGDDMRIIFGLFILFNIFIFIFGVSIKIPANKTFAWYGRVYKFLFLRIFSILKGAIFHPISFILLIFSFIGKIVFSFLMFFNEMMTTLVLPGVLSIISWYFIITKLQLIFILKILFCIVILIVWTYVCLKENSILTKLFLKLYLISCYLKQLIKNIYESSYETLLGNSHIYKKSPMDFYNEKKEAYYKKIERLKAESKNKTYDTKSKTSKHQKSYLDVLYSRELQLLDLYMQDFTMDDLNKRRKELLKLHHPDNYHTEKEIKYHQQIYNEIQKAYETLKKEKETPST